MLLEGEAYRGFVPILDLLGETAFTSVPAPDLALVMTPGGLVSGLVPKPAKACMHDMIMCSEHLSAQQTG